MEISRAIAIFGGLNLLTGTSLRSLARADIAGAEVATGYSVDAYNKSEVHYSRWKESPIA